MEIKDNYGNYRSVVVTDNYNPDSYIPSYLFQKLKDLSVLMDSGTPGQVLMKTQTGIKWVDLKDFNNYTKIMFNE